VELRGVIGEALGSEQIIEGTVWDNLTMTAPQASWEEVLSLCEVLDLRQEREALPEGFYTKLSAQGWACCGDLPCIVSYWYGPSSPALNF